MPPLIEEMDFGKARVYTLRGPRQVGKTTAVKFLIRRLLLSEGAWPRVLYFSLDLERQPEAIVEIVDQAKALFPQETGPWCIFLDEVSSIPQWQRGVKYLRDQTNAVRDTFVLTGSSSTDIRKGAERLPGRRGPGVDLDKILFPLSFRDFCKLQGIPAPDDQHFAPARFVEPDTDIVLKEGMLYLRDLKNALSAYLSVGGFPQAVREYLETGQVSEDTVHMLWNLLAGDVDRVGLDRVAALKLLERAARSLGTPTSWQNVAREMGVGSPQTAQRYATQLSEAFAMLVVHFWDLGRASVSLRKNKKLYFADPLFSSIPGLLQPGGPTPSAPLRAESLVAGALYRAEERNLVEGFRSPSSLFYWHSKKGREIDFLAGGGSRKVPIEVKYQQAITGTDKLAIRNSFGKGIILSQQDLDLEGPVRVIPTSLFLWLLEAQA